MVNPPQRLGYKRFGNDMLLDFYKAERDAIEAICPGKPWYMMEHSTSAVQWKPLNTRKRAGELWELDGVPAITSHPITMFGRPRWSGPGRRFRYDFPALSSMIRGVLSPGTGTPDDR